MARTPPGQDAPGSHPLAIRQPRLRDVADEAGVSVTTASVVLTGVPNSGIPAVTRERVRKAARKLGYVPNFSAQSLRTKRSRTIGFIADGVATSPMAGQIIAGAQAAAWKNGYVLLIVDAGELEDLAESAAQVLLARRVEAVIVASWYHRAVEVPATLRAHVPVLADCYAKTGRYPSIVPDEAGGGYLATRRLLERERGPIALVNFDMKQPAGRGRLKGCKRALQEAGVAYDPTLLMVSPRRPVPLWRQPFSATLPNANSVGTAARSGPRVFEASSAYEQTKRLLGERPEVRLIFCYNDRSAMGAYEAIKTGGLRIPEDIAVVGFDNQEVVADELIPGLTTVALPHYEMGEQAVERALELAHGQSAKAKNIGTVHVPCQLVERRSV